MLRKPVIAISYDIKNDALLEGVGLGSYSQPIDDLNIDRLIDQFTNLRVEFRRLERSLRERIDEYRRTWQMEYERILRM
jgi:polysaccharide pyruvyl transferase WcaK-like protein